MSLSAKQKVIADDRASTFLSACLLPVNQANSAVVFADMPELGKVLTRIGEPRGQTGLPLLFGFIPLAKVCSLTSFVLVNDDFRIYNNANHIMFATPGTVKSPALTAVERCLEVRHFILGVLFPFKQEYIRPLFI